MVSGVVCIYDLILMACVLFPFPLIIHGVHVVKAFGMGTVLPTLLLGDLIQNDLRRHA